MLDNPDESKEQEQSQSIPQDEKIPSSQHLVFLLHGMFGSPTNFSVFVNHLEEERSSNTSLSDLTFHAAASNRGKTTDGIENGAKRAFLELLSVLKGQGVQTSDEMCTENVNEKSPYKFNKISFIGHSLGGLYARYLLRLLDDAGVFLHVEPIVFATFATPHCGVKIAQKVNPFPFDFFPRVITRMLGKSIHELSMYDNNKMMLLLADDAFLKPLKRFRRRVLYSNVKNDPVVGFMSSSIRAPDAYPYDGNHCCSLIPCNRGRSSYSDKDTRKNANFCEEKDHANWKTDHSETKSPENNTEVSTSGIPDNKSTKRQKAKMQLSAKYKNLTEFSVVNGVTAVKVIKEVRCCEGDDGCEFHSSSFWCTQEKLGTLSWERYDAVFAIYGNAHEMIISKNRKLAGKSVVQHFVKEILIT